MKKNRIIELVVKVAVAALTAFLTALGTTSCMGHGPIWSWMVKGSWWRVVFNSLSNLELKWVKSPAGNVLAGLSSFRINQHTRWVRTPTNWTNWTNGSLGRLSGWRGVILISHRFRGLQIFGAKNGSYSCHSSNSWAFPFSCSLQFVFV